jgi:hypothetical protein
MISEDELQPYLDVCKALFRVYAAEEDKDNALHVCSLIADLEIKIAKSKGLLL